MTDPQWEVFSYEAVVAAAVLYFLAMLAYFFELASLRTASKEAEIVSVGADGGAASSAVALDREPAPSRRSEVAGRLGLVLTVFAVVVHFVGPCRRGLARRPQPGALGQHVRVHARRAPSWSHSSSCCPRCAIDIEWLGPLVTTFVVAALMAAFLGLDDAVLPLPDALNSPWLVIHVVVGVISTGAFTLGGMLSGLYLVKQRSERVTTGYLARLPELGPRPARPTGCTPSASRCGPSPC